MSDTYDGIHTCVLCEETFVGWGNNPEPLANYEDGRCCNDCNSTKVIPARIRRMANKGAFGTGGKKGGGE